MLDFEITAVVVCLVGYGAASVYLIFRDTSFFKNRSGLEIKIVYLTLCMHVSTLAYRTLTDLI